MIKSSRIIVLSFFFLLLFSGVADATTQNITNSAYVESNNPNINYGSSERLNVANDGYFEKTYIELPYYSSEIVLFLYANYSLNDRLVINSTTYFNESNITWNNRPSDISILGAYQMNNTVPQWKSFIITNPTQYISIGFNESNLTGNVEQVFKSDDNFTHTPYILYSSITYAPSGYVKDSFSTPIANAQVSTFGGACLVLSDSNGFYDCTGIADSTYQFTGAKVGYTSNSTSYQVVSGSGNSANLTLTATTSSPSIISWQNNKTSNNSLNISEYPTDIINFNVTANQSITSWNWYKDSVLQVNNFDNYTTTFAVGSHTLSVNGSNTLGTTSTITWNITQPTPDITSWSNNKTNNDTLSLSVISANNVKFNATANQTIATWRWYKDNVLQSNNYDNYTTKFLDGSHTLIVNASNVNGATNSITWTIDSGVSYDPSGYVNDSSGKKLAYATVKLSNATFNTSVNANATGYWNTNIYADGLYNWTVSKGGFVVSSGNQTFNVGGTNNNFTLSCLGNLTACNIPDTNSRGFNLVYWDLQGNGFNLLNFSWIHSTSGYIFPDNTVQTTAFNNTVVDKNLSNYTNALNWISNTTVDKNLSNYTNIPSFVTNTTVDKNLSNYSNTQNWINNNTMDKNYSNLTNVPTTFPNSSVPALQSNDSYFNGSVFPNSTNFKNDTISTHTTQISALQSNDTYFNGSVFPNSTNFKNDSLQSQINGKEPTISQGVSPQFWMFNKTWQNITTSWITEGVNLWFTNARAISAVQSILDAMNSSSASNNTASQGRDDSINSTKANKTEIAGWVKTNISNSTSANLTYNSTSGAFDLSFITCSGNNFYQSADGKNISCVAATGGSGTNYSVNVTGQPAIPNYASFNGTDGINLTQSGNTITISLNLNNVTMITANGSLIASNIPDGLSGITNITLSGGLTGTWT